MANCWMIYNQVITLKQCWSVIYILFIRHSSAVTEKRKMCSSNCMEWNSSRSRSRHKKRRSGQPTSWCSTVAGDLKSINITIEEATEIAHMQAASLCTIDSHQDGLRSPHQCADCIGIRGSAGSVETIGWRRSRGCTHGAFYEFIIIVHS